jgi:carboxyl-terminal processing protease
MVEAPLNAASAFMTTRTRLSILLISTPLLLFVLVGGLLGSSTPADAQFQHLRVFDDVVALILNNYVEEPNMNKVMEGAMRGLADGLDPDSAYLTAEEVKAVNADEKAPAGDVGIELTRQYYLRVVAVRDDSPAAKAGLQTGDYVRAIDGKASRDLSVFEGMRMLHGEPGSKVTLTVIRGNAAEPRDFTLVREKTPGALVSGKIIGGDLGYIRVATFEPGTDAKIRAQAADLSKAGAKHLLIDIRRNAEGPIASGIDAARLFVKSGTLVEIAGRDAAAKPSDTPVKPSPASVTETIAAKPGDGAIALPVTLLVTTGTSGAAEVFAAALVGNKRADVVGERTLGRAAAQKLVPLPDGRGLWLTYERYLTPAGDSIEGKGVTPDQEVEEPEVDFDQTPPTGDAILDAAVARAHKGAA